MEEIQDKNLKLVPINEEIITESRWILEEWGELLDSELILKKNAEYGNNWQAEGPFLAASRIKDKIVRVNTLIELGGGNKKVIQETAAEGFQNILECMAYCRLLMLYWAYNDLGANTTIDSVENFYNDLVKIVNGQDPWEEEDEDEFQSEAG